MEAQQARVASLTASLGADIDAELGLDDSGRSAHTLATRAKSFWLLSAVGWAGCSRQADFEKERAAYQQHLQDHTHKLDEGSRPAQPSTDLAEPRRAARAQAAGERKNPYAEALASRAAAWAGGGAGVWVGGGKSLADKLAAMESKFG